MDEVIVNELTRMDDRDNGEDEGVAQGAEAASEEKNVLWNRLQSELNVEIPIYVKNIMRLCQLDQPLNFCCIRDETLAELEKFARKRMIYQLVGVEVNLQDYYGPFYKMPNRFEFPVGDRFLIQRLVARAKSKSEDFWKSAPKPSQRTSCATTTATTTTTTTGPTRATRTRLSSGSSGRHEQQLQRQFEQQQAEDSSSELELEEEEKPEEPLDLNQERRKLADMVRSALLKEDYGEGLDSRQVAARVKVRVTVKTCEEGGLQRELVTGFIKCVFCPTKLMIRKQVIGARRPRWVISNYRRHIRFHLDGKLKRPTAQDFAKQQQQQQQQQLDTPGKPRFYLVNCDSKMFDEEDDHDDHADESNETKTYDEEQA